MVLIHLLLILVPGVGQVMQDRHLPALIYFFIFAFFVNALIVGQHVLSVPEPRTLRYACGGLAGLVWMISAYDYLRTAATRRRARAEAPSLDGDESTHG